MEEKKFSFQNYKSEGFTIPKKKNKLKLFHNNNNNDCKGPIIDDDRWKKTKTVIQYQQKPILAPAFEPEKKKNKISNSTDVVADKVEIKSIHDYSLELQNNQDVIFIRRLEETGRLADPYIKQLPDMTQVLSYISTLENKPPWYISFQENLINNENLKFPKLDVLNREFIIRHLRSPLRNEKPCDNPKCESERLGGFRCIPLTLPNNTWCYLCHLFFTNCLYLESINRKKNKDREYQINYFMVLVDQPGEYRLDQMLMGEKDVRGLYGTFPTYNVNNYKKYDLNNGCKAWLESDTMVFRLSRAMSLNQTESCSIILQDKVNDFIQ